MYSVASLQKASLRLSLYFPHVSVSPPVLRTLLTDPYSYLRIATKSSRHFNVQSTLYHFQSCRARLGVKMQIIMKKVFSEGPLQRE